jgi:outer membrane receptor for ferrienterochelin and colicin
MAPAVNTGVMPEISSLEKVEVLKGSAAILYGNVGAGRHNQHGNQTAQV